MKLIETAYQWYGKRNVRIVMGVIAVLVLIVLFTGDEQTEEETAATSLPLVSVATPSALSGTQSVQLIGTVRSVTEATLESETSGRVISVRTALGDTVSAGSVLVELENAAAYASLLQAEGAYEAAQAAAAQSDSSLQNAETAVRNAQNAAVTAVGQAYTTVTGAVYGDIDTFYRSPQTISISLKIGTNGNSQFLQDQRRNLQAVIENWQAQTATLTSDDNLRSALSDAIVNTQQVVTLIDEFISLTTDSSIANTQIDGVTVSTYTASLVSTRSALNQTLSALQSAQTNLDNSSQTLAQAEIGSTQGNSFSAANAQLKQALGSLRAAQANYEKTIVRTPISGEVQSLSVQTGDFVSAFQPVAKVVGAGGLEVTTFVGDSDRSSISIGQTVQLENGEEGVVTNIAPAVDAITKKTEVRIATEAETISNGDTVRIILQQNNTSEEVVVPLAAIKLTSDLASVLLVEDGVLVSRSVELGDIRGAYAVITTGLTNDELIVSDVRGFTSGQQVDVK